MSYIYTKAYSQYGASMGRRDNVTVEETLQAAREQLKCYNENEAYPHRIIKKRVKKEL